MISDIQVEMIIKVNEKVLKGFKFAPYNIDFRLLISIYLIPQTKYLGCSDVREE